MSNMTTLSQVLNILKDEGYTTDFNLRENCLVCGHNSIEVEPDDFVVDRHYRFEGETDPSDAAIIYAISSEKHGVKGVLVNGYGLYSDPMSDKMIRALEDKSSHADRSHAQDHDDKSASASIINLADAIHKLSSDITKDVNSVVLHETNGLTLLLITLNPGAELKKHIAPGPISVHVLQGSISFRTDYSSQNLTAGMIKTLDGEVPHSVFGNDRSVFLVTKCTSRV